MYSSTVAYIGERSSLSCYTAGIRSHAYTKLCCCAARGYSETLNVLWFSKANRPCIVAQLCILVSEARSSAMQRGQANMYTKLCCCAARAYSETLIVLWYSKVNRPCIVAQLCVLVNEARSATMQRGQADMYTARALLLCS